MTPRTSKNNPKWLRAGIKGGNHHCLCCPSTVEVLPLNTKIYSGFGGWVICKGNEIAYKPKVSEDYEDAKTLQTFENMAKKEPDREWTARLDLPLRSAVYQRHGDNTWVLIETGQGFA